MTMAIEPQHHQKTDRLTQKIEEYENATQRALGEYIRDGQKRSANADQSLHILNGWGAPQKSLLDPVPSASGGYMIRWDNKGIVVNPSHGFLQAFHAQAFHIRDIDFVIVTEGTEKTYTDISEIHQLNNQVNKLSTDIHTIHYYLGPKAYQDLLRVLRPQFKQERETIHCMELYADSPDLESFSLTPSINLHYFPTANETTIGIRIDLGTECKVGYISGCPWSPLLSHHLQGCDVLITALGETSLNDYDKVHYNPDSLGFFGCATLLDEAKPRLLLCTEIDGKQGDIRLELARRLREESTNQTSIVLPADRGLTINLDTNQITSTLTNNPIAPEEACILSPESPFGPLTYISPNQIL